MGKFTLGKDERLSREIWIKELFDKGSSFYLHPFKILYLPHPAPEAPWNQVLFSVSKRNFRKATERNTIKRRLREAYRLNKSRLPTSSKWLIAYIYTAKAILPSATIHQKVQGSIQKLSSINNDKG